MQGGSRGPGVSGVGFRGFQTGVGGVLGQKHEKTRKTLRNCVASLLRSNIQDFVQEVPVGQMAQGTPFRCGYAHIQICIDIYICTLLGLH